MRPDETEYVPWAKPYVAAVEGTDLVAILTANGPDFVALASRLDGAHGYAPDKWTVNEVIGHVIDTERILAYRLLCVARGDQSPFPGFEQDDYMATSNFNERSLAGLLAEFEVVRQSSILLIANLPADS